MTQPVRGAARFGVLSGYPSPRPAIGMVALGVLAALLSLLSGNWWLVLAGLVTGAVGVRWWFETRSLPATAPQSGGTDASTTGGPDGHR